MSLEGEAKMASADHDLEDPDAPLEEDPDAQTIAAGGILKSQVSHTVFGQLASFGPLVGLAGFVGVLG